MHPRTDLWSDLFGSSAQSLQNIMKDLNNVTIPSVGSKEFQDFWSLTFGFAVLVSIVAAVLSLLVYAKARDLAVILNALITLVTTFFVGFFLPPALYLATWGSKKLTLIIMQLPNGVQSKPTDTWYQIYSAIVVVVTNPGSVFGNQLFGDILTWLLEWLVSSVVTCLFLFAFLTLAAFPIRRIGFGFSLYRLGFAGIITTVFLQPLVLFVLALGAIAMKLSGADVGNLNNSLAAILLVACVVPFILFFFVYRKIQKVQIEGPVATSGAGSFGPFNGISVGRAQSRNYAGRIPQAGDTMESVAGKANWVGNKLSVAAKALSVTAPEAVPIVGALAATANTVGSKALERAEAGRHAAEEKDLADSEPFTPPSTESPTSNSGAVVPLGNASPRLSDDPSSTALEIHMDTPDQIVKPSKGEAVRQGASNVANGASSAAYGIEKAARWMSGAQRKAKQQLDHHLRR